MIRATTRFVDLPWYTTTLSLAGNFPWKQYITKIEKTRANGTGFDTFTGAAFPSLTTLVNGGFYRLDLKNLPTGGVDIDNGTPPTGGSNTPDYWKYSIPASPADSPYEEVYDLNIIGLLFGAATFVNSATQASIAGVCQFRLDGGDLLSAADFNAAVAAIPDAEVEAQTHQYSIAASCAVDATMTLAIL